VFISALAVVRCVYSTSIEEQVELMSADGAVVNVVPMGFDGDGTRQAAAHRWSAPDGHHCVYELLHDPVTGPRILVQDFDDPPVFPYRLKRYLRAPRSAIPSTTR